MRQQESVTVGVFAYFDDLMRALDALKAGGIAVSTVYSPARNNEIISALGFKPSPVRYFTLVGGALGIATGFGLSIYTAAQWHFIVSGKPPIPTVPYVIEGFEFCILIAVFFNLAGIIFNTRLPRLKLPEHYNPRFSIDRYGILITGPDAQRHEAREILTRSGAEEVYDAAS